jgi:hypothetical protein
MAGLGDSLIQGLLLIGCESRWAPGAPGVLPRHVPNTSVNPSLLQCTPCALYLSVWCVGQKLLVEYNLVLGDDQGLGSSTRRHLSLAGE